MGFFKKKTLGVDIGNDSIKIIEASVSGGRKKLENYAQASSLLLSKEPLLKVNEEGSLAFSNLISSALKQILKEAKIQTKKVVFSLPDFLTFAASFQIPQMPKQELPGAIYYNASKYLTLPVSEVTLDWRIVESNSIDKSPAIKVFLIAVPNQVIGEYQKLSKESGLELCALEPEVFGMTRALVKDEQKTICLIDMGAGTSTVNIIDRGELKESYSIDFGSSRISKGLSLSLGFKLDEAEKVKNKEGMLSAKENVAKTLKDSTNSLLSETKRVFDDFFAKEQKQIDELYLTGGMALLPGLKEYLQESLKKPVSIPNCFLNFIHPKALENSLLEMSPRFSAAAGVALGMLDV